MRPDVRPGQAHDDGEPPHQPPPTSTQVGTCRGGQGDRDCRVTGNEPVPGVGRAAKYHVEQDRPRARPLGDPLDHLGDEPGGEPGSGQVDCQPDPATGQRSKRQRRCGQHVPQLHDHKEPGAEPAGKIVGDPEHVDLELWHSVRAYGSAVTANSTNAATRRMMSTP